MNPLQRYLARLRLWLSDSERGDVPGWVLIVVMTAALVLVIWGLAEGFLQQLFEDAMNSISNR